MKIGQTRRNLLQIYQAAVDAVDGRRVTAKALQELAFHDDANEVAVVSLGKAAVAMFNGAFDAIDSKIGPALVVTKHDHEAGLESDVELLTGGHPVPDESSLAAGERLIRFVSGLPDDMPLLVLISGGTSSIAESLIPGVDLELLRNTNQWLLGSGLPIDKINSVRSALSEIKAGGLCRFLGKRSVTALLISDVEGDDPAVIGSGPLMPRSLEMPETLPDWLRSLVGERSDRENGLGESIDIHIIATLEKARHAAAEEAQKLGYEVRLHPEFIDGDVGVVCQQLIDTVIKTEPALHIWGGETTVVLPDNPGRGGRNQQMALIAAQAIAERNDCFFLSAGTDGSDGPTEDAGALVDGDTISRGHIEGLDEKRCLQCCNSGDFLEASGDLITTGPTGTNVMDLMIALRQVDD